MRRTMMAGLVLIPTIALCEPAYHASLAKSGSAQGDLSVTIYSNDLALV